MPLALDHAPDARHNTLANALPADPSRKQAPSPNTSPSHLLWKLKLQCTPRVSRGALKATNISSYQLNSATLMRDAFRESSDDYTACTASNFPAFVSISIHYNCGIYYIRNRDYEGILSASSNINSHDFAPPLH